MKSNQSTSGQCRSLAKDKIVMALLFRSRALLGFSNCKAPLNVCNYRHLFFRSRCSQNARQLSQNPGVTLKEGRDSVEIKWNGKKDTTSAKFHYMWLRDNCQCQECYHPDTLQRLSDVLNIKGDLKPTRVGLSDDRHVESDSTGVSVEWEDGHMSLYSLSWLQSHCYDWKGEKPHFENPLTSRVDPIVWGREIGDTPPIVDYSSFMKDDQTFLEWSDKVDQYGFCFIDGIPLEPSNSKHLLERVGVLRQTMYGNFSDVEMNSKPSDELEVG